MLSIKMALRSISSNKMRAALTMLGIIIGVMALVVLVSLVNGATSSVTDAVSGLGTSMLTVSVSDDKGSPLDLTILLGGIAAISLVVGGIGIMNIMLVTVTERTREIGIRKAIGASRGTILSQFLMEAVVLCMLGCGLGIFLSWAILQTVSTVVASLNMTFSLDGGVVLIAVMFCFVIGVAFGLYPANKAAKMKPIDALHYGG